MKVVLKDRFQKVYGSSESVITGQYIHNVMQGFLTPIKLKAALTTSLNLKDQTMYFKMLNDIRLIQGPWEHFIDHDEKSWSMRVKTYHVRCLAQVLPQFVVKRLSEEQIHRKETGFCMHAFESVQDAVYWLTTVETIGPSAL